MNPNTATLTTVRQLLSSALYKGRDTAWSAYCLACTIRRGKTWGEMLETPIRVPARSMAELIRKDQAVAIGRGFPVPSSVQLMREGIADGLSAVTPGKGNRAIRRIEALNMGARRKMHLNCA